jgi:glycosyltransferase involved in cell wall biosynthesis
MSLAEMKKHLSPLPRASIQTFAFVGRFDDTKQPMLPLQAVKNIQTAGRRVRLLMAGDGPEQQKKSIKRFVAENNLENSVELLGYVGKISDVYRKSYALLLPSRSEALPRVVAEAMAHGRPVIGANGSSMPEIIHHGHDGLIFNAGDAEDLSEKMKQLLDEPQLASYLGANAAVTAQHKFTNERYVESVLQIYDSILKAKSN